MAAKKQLTPKQQQFVAEYLIDLNGTAAAARCGYKHPNKQGPRLLVHVGISQAISAAQAKAIAKLEKKLGKIEMTSDRVLEELFLVARGDIGDIMDFTGDEPRLKLAKDISPEARRLISSLKLKRYVEGHGDTARTVEVTDLKLCDKLRALHNLAMHYKLLTQSQIANAYTSQSASSFSVSAFGVEFAGLASLTAH